MRSTQPKMFPTASTISKTATLFLSSFLGPKVASAGRQKSTVDSVEGERAMNRKSAFEKLLDSLLIILFLAPSIGTAQITEIIDETGDGQNSFRGARSLGADNSGNIYVTGFDSNNAFKITPNGITTQIIDETGDGLGNPLRYPRNLRVSSSGNVYLIGESDTNVLRITPDGAITDIFDINYSLTDIAVDSDDNVFVLVASEKVCKVTPAGDTSVIIDESGDGLGNTLVYPKQVVVSPSGNAYVRGYGNDNVFKITPADPSRHSPGQWSRQFDWYQHDQRSNPGCRVRYGDRREEEWMIPLLLLYCSSSQEVEHFSQ